MTSNAQLTLEKCVFLALQYVCVCAYCCMFSLLHNGERSHSYILHAIFFLSASFPGRGTETSHKGGIDSVAQHSFSSLLCSLLCDFIKIIIPLAK